MDGTYKIDKQGNYEKSNDVPRLPTQWAQSFPCQTVILINHYASYLIPDGRCDPHSPHEQASLIVSLVSSNNIMTHDRVVTW